MSHDTGVVTNADSNAARSTATSSTEERLVVDAVDKVFLLEPNKHPLVSLLTNVGKVWDGKGWTGSSLLKAPTGNPEFKKSIWTLRFKVIAILNKLCYMLETPSIR